MEKEKQEGMDWKGVRRFVLMAGEGQPLTSTIAGNHDPFACRDLSNPCSCRGAVEKWRRP